MTAQGGVPCSIPSCRKYSSIALPFALIFSCPGVNGFFLGWELCLEIMFYNLSFTCHMSAICLPLACAPVMTISQFAHIDTG